ncbi:hypothetical protein WOSG25_200050 [Weissella oryzae SG25]|uniref:Uncharacterized protein n=1 Tax=Weissella oryzae (strain DSM 25784 / JCM 18191 / LMG 30913 / SG25) TaxID=1329250 RepID=A0A069CXG7_WEIOS|nr:hypothetical protein [Weissella oryzae]GAK31923.1 hypothetical protein WOSG25_200050 [Weissella oryzae SG25]
MSESELNRQKLEKLHSSFDVVLDNLDRAQKGMVEISSFLESEQAKHNMVDFIYVLQFMATQSKVENALFDVKVLADLAR